MIIKECMRCFEFNLHAEFDNSIDDNEDDTQLNLFGTNEVECDPQLTSLIGARLARIYANSNDENSHNILKSDVLAEFETMIEN